MNLGIFLIILPILFATTFFNKLSLKILKRVLVSVTYVFMCLFLLLSFVLCNFAFISSSFLDILPNSFVSGSRTVVSHIFGTTSIFSALQACLFYVFVIFGVLFFATGVCAFSGESIVFLPVFVGSAIEEKLPIIKQSRGSIARFIRVRINS